MEFIKKFFPAVLPENEATYFASLKGVIESVDELSALEIIRTPSTYNFRLIPSVPKYTNLLIQELTKFHNIIGIRMDLSKSIKTSSTITFKVPIYKK